MGQGREGRRSGQKIEEMEERIRTLEIGAGKAGRGNGELEEREREKKKGLREGITLW